MTKCYKKICQKCWSQETKKDGKRRWKQSYKCSACKYVWISKNRKKKKDIDICKLYKRYAVNKQTYEELAEEYQVCSKTIQRYLDRYEYEIYKSKPREIILLIDTTYFGSFGLMVFKDKKSKDILHYDIVNYETNEEYKRWISILKEKWWKIKAIVCDWRRGLLWWFGNIPTQMCHFHQKQIIRKYLTKNPIIEANKELNDVVKRLHRTDKLSFIWELNRWYKKHKEFLKERWINDKWKPYYIHKRTRSAYFSLKRNLEYLFVYLDYLWKNDIPNTTNGLEWLFWHLKYKVFLHRWLREDRKKKLIIYLLNSRK